MLTGESLSVIDDEYLIMQKIEMLPGVIATHAISEIRVHAYCDEAYEGKEE